MTLAPKKWIVGLDLRSRSQGAMHWAAALSRRSAADEHLLGIHVLEEAHLRVALRYHHLRELLETAEQAVRNTAIAIDPDAWDELHVLQGGTAERSLGDAAILHDADGIVVGRLAPREGAAVTRLGRVARRTLRELVRPVVVVPPDLETIAGGPVILATDVSDDSVAAARFAVDVAARLDRPLVLAHVVSQPDDYGAHYLPAVSIGRLREDHQREGEAALAAWATQHELTGERVVAQGGVVPTLLELAKTRNAALIVTGSRKLSTFDRILLTSVGSQAAAHASTAVAVVPTIA